MSCAFQNETDRNRPEDLDPYTAARPDRASDAGDENPALRPNVPKPTAESHTFFMT